MNRSLRRKALVQFLIVAGLVLTVLVLTLCWPSRQPSYQGHPFAYWFRELPFLVPASGPIPNRAITVGVPPRSWGHHETPSAAIAAIQAMGTNAVPFLLPKLRRGDAPQPTALQLVLLKIGYRRPLFANIEAERGQALTALICLAPLPPGTLAELRQMSNTATNSAASRYAAVVLQFDTNSALRDALQHQFQ